MKCPKCGKEIEEGLLSCPECGAVLTSNTRELKVKPTFKFLCYKRLKGDYFLASFIIVIITTMLIAVNKEDAAVAMVFLIIISFILVIYWLYVLIIGRLEYKKAYYLFKEDVMNYQIGIINTENKMVRYKHIKEITVTSSIFQRMFNLGTIKLSTSAEGSFNESESSSRKNKRSC